MLPYADQLPYAFVYGTAVCLVVVLFVLIGHIHANGNCGYNESPSYRETARASLLAFGIAIVALIAIVATGYVIVLFKEMHLT